MELDDPLGPRQADAAAGNALDVPGAPERLEDVTLIVRWNADSAILDAEDGHVVAVILLPRDADSNLAAIRAVLDGIPRRLPSTRSKRGPSQNPINSSTADST